MSQHSEIEWTDATWNPVTGCTKVSSGCDNCYAERFAERWRGVEGHPYQQGFDLRLWPDRLDLPMRWRKRRNIFVNSMSDLFHPGVSVEFIERVFYTMRRASWHVFQVLTKRPQRMRHICNEVIEHEIPNVWLGTSVEGADSAWRINILRETRAAVRFVSIEPLLEEVGELNLDEIDWVIVGGESGPGARPMEVDWVRSIRDQCLEQATPFFFKQWGGVFKKRNGRALDGREWDQMPVLPTENAQPLAHARPDLTA